jgi:drug/metabolite transporter (DMT)-like permease
MATAPALPPQTGKRQASSAMIWSALVVVYLIWGSTYLAIRVVVEAHIPPMLGMSSRFLAAAVLLAAYLVLKSGWQRLQVTRRDLRGRDAFAGVR